MSKTIDVFFLLLRGVLTGDRNEVALEEAEYEPLYELSQFHALSHLIYFELKKRELLSDNIEISQKFKYEYDKSVLCYLHRSFAIVQIREILEKERIPFILLKGAHLKDLYPEEWMRTSSDIDLIVKQEDYDRVTKAFIDSGMKYYGKGSHDAVFRTVYNFKIELHFTLMEEYRRPKSAKVLKDIWNHSVRVKDSVCEYTLNDEMFYYYHIAHMYKHFEDGGCGVRFFMDLWLLNHRISFDKEKREGLLKTGELLTFAKISGELSDFWFSDRQSDETIDEYARFVINSGIYGTVSQRVAVLTKKRGKTSFSYYFSRVFPPFREMKGRYPDLEKKPLLLPFYWIKRFLTLFKSKTKSRAMLEFNAEKNIDKNEAKRIEELMRRLDIF